MSNGFLIKMEQAAKKYVVVAGEYFVMVDFMDSILTSVGRVSNFGLPEN